MCIFVILIWKYPFCLPSSLPKVWSTQMKTSAEQTLLIRWILNPDGQDCPEGDHHTSVSPSPALSNQNPAEGGLNYVPNMEMALCLSAGRIPTSLLPLENANRATGPEPKRIPNEICTGENRWKTLKRKAAQISYVTSELFAYFTSRTTSIEDAAQLLSAVTASPTRVPAHFWYKLRSLHTLHSLHIIVCIGRIHPSRRSVPLFAINGHQHNEISHARCRDLHWFPPAKQFGTPIANRKWIHSATQKWMGISTDSAAEVLLHLSSGHNG